jgi:glycosyltransferase involved in cell wall biosynthesis
MELRKAAAKIQRKITGSNPVLKPSPKVVSDAFPDIANKVHACQSISPSGHKILQAGITDLVAKGNLDTIDNFFVAINAYTNLVECAALSHSLVIGCLQGEYIPNQFQDSVATVMAAADLAISSSDCDVLLNKAQEMLFHSFLHFAGNVSPLSQNPKKFLQHWDSSTLIQEILKGEIRERENTRKTVARTDVASGVCFTTFTNRNFLQQIMDHAKKVSGATDFIDIRSKEFTHVPLTIDEQIAYVRGNHEWDYLTLDSILKHETIFVEWGQRAAVVLSHLARKDQRIVVRIHSYEPFTIFPHLIDAAGVDQLIFVSNIIRNLVFESTPHLASIPTVVLPNAMDLAKFTPEKSHKAAKTLTMLGYGNPEKDPKWTLHLLKDLLKSDAEWRLQCVGHFFPRTARPADVRYSEEFTALITELELDNHVDLVGQVDDVSDALRDTGWIISASIRESFHQAVAEGAASGAVPVVRNWPGVAQWGGPADVYPSDWVVTTPQEAAARIRSLESTRIETGLAAREWVLSNLDWSVVADRYTIAIWGE